MLTRHRRLVPLAALVAATAIHAAPAHAAPAAIAPRDIVAAQRSLHLAATQGSLQDILGARARFAAIATTAPKSAWAHYWVAVADWDATPRFDEKSKALASRTCEEGLAEIDKAIALNPTEGEFHALRASLLGISLNFHPGSMMTIGPEIGVTMERALKLSPNNPRVQLMAGINTLNKPAFIGGGADKALPVFKRSQELFESAAVTDSTAPSWGEDQAWIWAGRASMKLGDPVAARDAYRKALTITPGHGWVTRSLLPEAEQAIAGGTATKQ